MNLNDKLTEIKGVGDQLAKKFNQLNIFNIEDLLTTYPRKYVDFSKVTPINRIKPGNVTIKATIKQARGRYVRGGLHITEAAASDETGSLFLVWFNQPYRANSLKSDTEYYISGDFGLKRQRMSMVNPSIELVSTFPLNTARIVPIYREVKNLKSTQIRKIINSALPYLDLIIESLPDWMLKNYNLIPQNKAIKTMHFPESSELLDKAKNRIGFEEIFDLSLAALLSKNELLKEKALPIKYDVELAKHFTKLLPFKLTDEQKSVAHQILKDIDKTTPMNRLVEGDVGTGKTVVAAMAAFMTLNDGYQVALMAPTEILAKQHANTIYKVFENSDIKDKVSVMVGSDSSKKKELILKKLASGEISFIIGTHSLIQQKVNLKKLGLAIIDEQHRFGVKQRQAILLQAGHMSHLLSLTATPIPRSLQLTLFGDLDISIIKNKPYSKRTIQTSIVSQNNRLKLYEDLKKILEKKNQIFVVCPIITQNENLPFKSAEAVYKELKEKVYKDYSVELLHGRMKAEEKDNAMQKFIAGEVDVLVATTIIEVGVDVPNATVMVVEGPERFGLAQIHQLRGRVGRSDLESFCYLVQSDNERPSDRIRALESTTDGFKLAELDLKIRGPGMIYGELQHGKNILDLQVANLTDVDLIMQARSAAQDFIDKGENLLQYVQLNDRINRIRTVTNLN